MERVSLLSYERYTRWGVESSLLKEGEWTEYYEYTIKENAEKEAEGKDYLRVTRKDYQVRTYTE